MDLMQGGSADSGGLIIIGSVVVLGLIGTVLITLHMINTNKHKRILEANKMSKEMMELGSPGLDGDGSIGVKTRNAMFIKKLHKSDDIVNYIDDSAENTLKAENPLEGIVQYGDQYNANHDFAIFQGNDERLGGVMNLAQKQNQADCIADKSMSVADSSFAGTERGQPEWPHTGRDDIGSDGEDSKTPVNKSKRTGRSVKFANNDDDLPENQEWADLE